MMPDSLCLLSAATFLLLFLVIGIFDGLYFHLWKFKLHTHIESRGEHYIHTVRSFVFAFVAIPLYAINAGGLLLLATVGLLSVDLGLELADILIEKHSRKTLGGISSVETAVHIFASMARTASIVLILASKPLTAWGFSAELVQASSYPTYLILMGVVFSLFSFLGGIGHVLMVRPPILEFKRPIPKSGLGYLFQT